MQRPVMLLVAMTLLTAGAVWAQDGDAVLGLWATDPEGGGGEAHVRIFMEDGKYHGRIVWLAEPLVPPGDPKGTPGEPKTDVNNPDPALRDQPVIGLMIMEGFVFDGDDLWHRGTIYDPDNGKTYKCKIRFGDTEDVLKVRGFIGISMLGRTTEWTRVEGAE